MHTLLTLHTQYKKEWQEVEDWRGRKLYWEKVLMSKSTSHSQLIYDIKHYNWVCDVLKQRTRDLTTKMK